ncbi:MAG TPA: glycosyltransferase family 39 protein [Pyrinomonadaceae bacterium]|nr:glycosyltransferase family 39 protein [Pyrinomonadaceae bacterium]
MNAVLLALGLAIFGFVMAVAPTEGGPAALLMLPLVAIVCALIYRLHTDRKFLLRLFVSGLLIRVLIGTLIYFFHWQVFFGGDAISYDFFGNALLKVWEGHIEYMRAVQQFSTQGAGSGWGMLYMVAAIYKIAGQNMLATQYVNCVLGAASAVFAYLIAIEIFPNKRVARVCGLMTAFFPSMVLWSCQGLKDGPIILLLTLSMLATLKLGDRFSLKFVIVLALALFSLMTLRFYVFYIIVLAVAAAFILGRRRLTAQSFVRQMIVITIIGMSLAYFGVTRYATQQIEVYGNAEQLQRMRQDAAQSAQSGFAENVDVSTTTGALSAIPVGLTYLLLAPFPWQMASFRQVITLPEMLIWWASIPLLVVGAWFTLKHRLREVAPIIIFTSILTLTYSIVQGNVGTAYRQRAQLLVFYFVFVAVGFGLMKERREARIQKQKQADEAYQNRTKWGRDRNQGRMPVAS